MSPIRLFLAGVAALALTACGAPRSPAPSVPVGTITAANFGDSNPFDFAHPHPSRYGVHGIDVARYQDNIDWRTARANGVNFAFIKATEGGDRVDAQFDSHWRGAAAAGVARGAYHFYYFCTSPEDQARWFIRNVPRGNMLPPVLDMEWNPLSPTCAHVRPPGDEVRDQMRRFMKIITAHYGQRPIIYTTPKFFQENDLGRIRDHEFWLRSTAKTPAEAYPGQSWAFWQYTATGTVPGIAGAVDLNVFSGTRDAWQAWTASRAK